MEQNQPILQNTHSKSAEVKAFFDQTDNYLKADYGIRTRAIIINGLLGEVRNADILDIGCGDGSISIQFLPQENRVTLLDFSDQMLQVAKSRTPQEFQSQAQYLNMNFLDLAASEQYDVVLCIGVLAHVDSIEEAIKKVSALLKPGGRCVFQITDTDQFLGRMQHRFHAIRKSLKRLKKHPLNKTGFTNVRAVAARNGLDFVEKKRFMIRLPFPGAGRLPSSWLSGFDLFTARHPALGRYGAETVALFRKK